MDIVFLDTYLVIWNGQTDQTEYTKFTERLREACSEAGFNSSSAAKNSNGRNRIFLILNQDNKGLMLWIAEVSNYTKKR